MSDNIWHAMSTYYKKTHPMHTTLLQPEGLLSSKFEKIYVL
jgi:hypothetical protein